MSKLMDKISDKLSHLGKSDKSGGDAQEPLKASEPGKISEEPQATHTEDAGKAMESQPAQAQTTQATEEPAPAAQDPPTENIATPAPSATAEELTNKPVDSQPVQSEEATESKPPQPATTEEPTQQAQSSSAEEPAQPTQSTTTEEPAQSSQSAAIEEPASKPEESQPAPSEQPTESQAAQATSSEEPAESAAATSSEETGKSAEPEPAQSSAVSSAAAVGAVGGLSSETSKSVEPEPAQSEPESSSATAGAVTGTSEESGKGAEAAPQPTERKDVFVGSIDQGTTSSRFLIFDTAGEPVAVHQEEFKQIYPNPGWHEHDPIEIVESVEKCIDEAVKAFEADGHSKDSIKTIGITNQRETTVCWDYKTGEPLYNAIVWTDTRTAGIARELKAKDNSDKKDVCGLPISSYPSVTKLLWMLKNVDKVKEAYEAGNLAFGTIDAWLIYKLNGNKENPVFVSDPTNASRTMFMDIRTLKYSDEMLDFFSYEFDLRKVHMPEIVRSSDKESFGKMGSGPLKGWSITGCLGDQSSALVGQKGFQPGSAKNTYGTGCFLLYNVGDKPVISTHGLLATVAYHFDGEPVYALEGSIAVAGSGVKFLMENLGFESKSHRITELAESVDDNGGLVFVTAFSGLFAPYWIDDAQGTIFGITGHTKRGHVARATLEAVCYQTKAILDAMEKDSGHALTELKVDGGMSNSALCMQTQADLTQIPIIRPKMRETTALGAAIAAGFASGVWKSFDELNEVNTAGQTTFEAKMEGKESRKMFRRWEKAVGMCRGWLAEQEEEKSEEAAAKSNEEASKL